MVTYPDVTWAHRETPRSTLAIFQPKTFGTLANNEKHVPWLAGKSPSEDDYRIELPIFGRFVHTFSHVVMDFWLVDVLIQFVEG